MSASPSPFRRAIVADVVGDLRDDGIVTRGWLGVQIQPVTEDIAESLGIESTDGAIVADAMADGPAAGAGIEAGDIITKVNGKAVDESEGAFGDDRQASSRAKDHRDGACATARSRTSTSRSAI